MDTIVLAPIVKGATSQIIHFTIGDSSVTTGAGNGTLVFNTASLICFYIRPGDTGATSVTLATCTIGTWATGGFKQTTGNQHGTYEFHVPNACLASGADSVTIVFQGATGMRDTAVIIPLIALNRQLTPGTAGGPLICGSNTATTFASLTCTGTFNISDGLTIARSTGNSTALTITGTGTGSGAAVTGGLTGKGVAIAGGGTSGTGLSITTTDGDAVNIAATGSSRHGFVVQGGNGGTSDGLKLTAGTGGVSFRTGTVTMGGAVILSSTLNVSTTTLANLTVTGNISANQFLVTADVAFGGDFTVAGVVDVTGNVALHDGLTVTCTTGNQSAITLTGNGSGYGIRATGGATGGGIRAAAGGGNGTALLLIGSGSGVDLDASAKGIVGNITGSITSLANLPAIPANWLTAAGMDPDVATEIAAPILAKLPSALIGGRLDVSVGAYQSGQIPLQPTIAGRTLDVTTTGGAGIDWANVENQTSTVGLSGTTVALVTTVTNNPNAGNGAYSVQATVTDGTNPLQQATVRVTSGINTFSSVTDASGHVTFALDAGTYTITATKGGYEMTPTTRTVTGNNAGTLYTSPIVLTAIVIPVTPSDPSICIVYGYTRNTRTNALMPNVQVEAVLKPGVYAYADGILVGREVKTKSDQNGLFQLNLIRNSEITPTGTQWKITCRDANINTTQALSTSTLDITTVL